MNNKTINVLITSMGATTSIVVAKHIKASKLDVKIFGTDLKTKDELAGSAFVDVFFSVPSCKDASYIETMKELVKKNNIHLIIPIFDLEIFVLAQHAKEFAGIGCKIVASTPEAVQGTNDKYAFYKVLKQNQILTPETFTLKDWKNAADKETKKWILKPIQGVSSRDILVGNHKIIEYELSKPHVKDEDFFIQEFIEGAEFTVDVFAKDKKAYCCVPRERMETRGGLCYRARTVNNKKFLPIIDKLVSLFDFYGPINIQFLEKNSNLYCIEINPRFAGSSIISVASGVNMFDFIYKDFKGEKIIPLNQYKENLVMNRFWEEIFVESK